MHKQIAFISTAFGFGPVSKAIAIAQEIKKYNDNIVIDFFGFGIDYDMAIMDKSFNNVIKQDVDNTESLMKILPLLKSYTDVVSVMNFTIVKLWNFKNIKLHFVDSLFWMWDEIPTTIKKVNNYFIQNYLLDFNKYKKYSNMYNLKLVNIIQQEKEDRSIDLKNKILLVNFSGCSNPLVNDFIYYEYVLTLSKIIINESINKFDIVYISVQKKIARKLQSIYKENKRIKIDFYSHNVFLYIIDIADTIITSSGITTTLEILAAGKKPNFLLPQNYSQALLNEKNLKLFPNSGSMAFSKINKKFYVPEGLPEKEGVELVLKYLKEILNKEQDTIIKIFNNIVQKKNKLNTNDSLVYTGAKEIVCTIFKENII